MTRRQRLGRAVDQATRTPTGVAGFMLVIILGLTGVIALGGFIVNHGGVWGQVAMWAVVAAVALAIIGRTLLDVRRHYRDLDE